MMYAESRVNVAAIVGKSAATNIEETWFGQSRRYAKTTSISSINSTHATSENQAVVRYPTDASVETESLGRVDCLGPGKIQNISKKTKVLQWFETSHFESSPIFAVETLIW
jgi:hypothetical protein